MTKRRWVGWGAPKVKIKAGWGLDADMIESLYVIIPVICAVFAGFYLHLRILTRFIGEQVFILDQNIAEALKKIVEDLPIGNIEQPNPFAMMLMQIMQDNMAKNPAKLIPRNEAGQFQSESESESK